MMKLLAVTKVAKGHGNVELKEVPEPSTSPGMVKIKIKACGVCGTDVHILHDSYPNTPPVILGHEISGEIVEIGQGVTEFQIGDRVTCESHASICGQCLYCKQGLEKLCPQRKAIGRTADGGMAEYLVVRAGIIHLLPDNVDYASGALTQLVACAYHAVSERTPVHAGDLVVIFGPGATGLLSAQVAKAQGARVVVCGTTRSKSRLELAQKLGADMTINVQSENIYDIVNEMTNGLGADTVIECSGSSSAVNEGLNIIRKGGNFTQMGFVGGAINLEWDKVVHKDLVIRGVAGYTWKSWEGALQLVSTGQVKVEGLIGMELPLEDWEKAFRYSEERKAIRIVLKPELHK
jgi:L-iditol 2-dehydrogenase